MRQGIDWPGDRNWQGEMTGVHSGQRAQFRQDFGMIRLESSSSDCLMGMSFRGKGVNPSYTLRRGEFDNKRKLVTIQLKTEESA